MDFSPVELSAEQREFAKEVSTFLDEIITEEVHDDDRVTGNGFNLGMYLAMGQKGWLQPTWPKAQGGAGLDSMQNRILNLELERRQAPSITAGTTRLVWSAVVKHGAPDLVEELRPQVADGRARFCLGYTEPDGGSDIAAAKVRAVQDGDEWVLNGSKIFTTGAQNSQYTFLITRSDPDLPKHKGITMFLVPLATPGVEIQGIWAFSGERTNIVYYGDVRISDRYRIGGVNDGWSVLHGPLDAEHSIGGKSDGLDDLSIGRAFLRPLEAALDTAIDWANETNRPDGGRPIDDPSVQLRLGRVAAELEAGICTPGPLGRVKGSLALVEGAADLVDLTGPQSLIRHGEDGALNNGAIDFAHRFAQGTATYGGTIEVFRNIIAQHVLGLPRQTYPGSKVFIQRKQSAAASH
jgi:3-oxocholest-4-en-26-oyl-CoA dehydrogenase alpha subunit